MEGIYIVLIVACALATLGLILLPAVERWEYNGGNCRRCGSKMDLVTWKGIEGHVYFCEHCSHAVHVATGVDEPRKRRT